MFISADSSKQKSPAEAGLSIVVKQNSAMPLHDVIEHRLRRSDARIRQRRQRL
jgi:hypothetical protein